MLNFIRSWFQGNGPTPLEIETLEQKVKKLEQELQLLLKPNKAGFVTYGSPMPRPWSIFAKVWPKRHPLP